VEVGRGVAWGSIRIENVDGTRERRKVWPFGGGYVYYSWGPAPVIWMYVMVDVVTREQPCVLRLVLRRSSAMVGHVSGSMCVSERAKGLRVVVAVLFRQFFVV
jgi:hypothetical protein